MLPRGAMERDAKERAAAPASQVTRPLSRASSPLPVVPRPHAAHHQSPLTPPEAAEHVASDPTGALLVAPEHVLSTLSSDGSRIWLRPRLSRGRFLRRRAVVGWTLIAIFTAMPLIQIAGKPAMFLDVAGRRFTLFGTTFLPTDTLLLALLMLSVFLGIFLFTALFGRVWCGWACPQTVYLEFVYRPIERLFEGTAGRGGRPGAPPSLARRAGMYFTFLIVSLLLAHTFLAYFVGWDALRHWIFRSPAEHLGSFLVMTVTTGLMMFNFCYFREQTCTLACPYGRFQSVLLDRDSLIISYDESRGEPRGKLAALQAGTRPENGSPRGPDRRGDCIDCFKCVTTCPTGIDIRDGLQMECIGCAQCIDACDDVMDRIGRARGLIRYTSQNRLAAAPSRVLRGRVLFYSVGLLIAGSLLVYKLATRQPADLLLMRGPGLPFTTMQDGRISNTVRVKITNRTEHDAVYSLSVSADGPYQPELLAAQNPVAVAGGGARTEGVLIVAPREAFSDGHFIVRLRVRNGAGFDRELPYKLLGPVMASGARAGG